MRDSFKGKRFSKKPRGFKQEKVNHTPVEPMTSEETEEFESFFKEVTDRLPKKATNAIMKGYDKAKGQAEKLTEKSSEQFNAVFDQFLVGVDADIRKKAHFTIHAASLTAAIIGGISAIPFSDAFLLVPVQITMMGRLHKLFNKPFAENIGTTFARELVIVGLGRGLVGNLLKFIPGLGTIAGAAVNATVAMTITQALGWITVKNLNEGVDIFDDVMSFRSQFENLLKVLGDSSKNKK